MEKPLATTSSELVRVWARQTPDSIAYTFEGYDTTWRQFDAQVDEWARALLAQGIARGEAISILAGNHPYLLQLALAAARVGAHLAPLNTWHKRHELEYTIGHSDAVLLFAVDDLREQDYNEVVAQIIPELNHADARRELRSASLPKLRQVIALGAPLPGAVPLADFLARSHEITPERLREREGQNSPTDLMYLMYTSGSTSSPKAVQILQGDMLENMFQIGLRQGIEPDDRSWLATPMFYGLASAHGLFAAWTFGARVVLQEVFEPAEALEILDTERCTVYYGFGNLTRKLISQPGFDRTRVHLRKGILGFSQEDRRLAIDELGITSGTSVYGLTETYALVALTHFEDDREIVMGSQGHVLPGQEVRIVDPETDEELPQGEVGEVLVRGRITPGYFKDPERTQQAMTADGFFRTGDRASLRADGRFVYSSRASEMMKPGGVNVSPQEVEELLDGVPGILQAHVCSIPDATNGECVVAFIEADPTIVTPRVIRDHLRSVAASYKVPSRFIYRDDSLIPRLATGKVARFLLSQEAERELKDVEQ